MIGQRERRLRDRRNVDHRLADNPASDDPCNGTFPDQVLHVGAKAELDAETFCSVTRWRLEPEMADLSDRLPGKLNGSPRSQCLSGESIEVKGVSFCYRIPHLVDEEYRDNCDEDEQADRGSDAELGPENTWLNGHRRFVASVAGSMPGRRAVAGPVRYVLACPTMLKLGHISYSNCVPVHAHGF